jgi:hypothetical protein
MEGPFVDKLSEDMVMSTALYSYYSADVDQRVEVTSRKYLWHGNALNDDGPKRWLALYEVCLGMVGRNSFEADVSWCIPV